MRKPKNYRQKIVAIAARYDRSANDDFARALLEGVPAVVTTTVALRIAEWLETEAPIAWNPDDEELYDQVASDIRSAVARAK